MWPGWFHTCLSTVAGSVQAVTPVSLLPGSLVGRAGWDDAAPLQVHEPYSIRPPLPVIHLGFGARVLWDLKRFEMYLLTVFLLGFITDLIFIGLWQNMAITLEVPSFNVFNLVFLVAPVGRRVLSQSFMASCISNPTYLLV